MISIEDVKKDLMKHEGFSSHVYKDHLGYWTIGYGRLVDESRGGGISEDEAKMLLRGDIRLTRKRLSRNLDFFDDAPRYVQRALINMAFQLGVDGLLRFKKTIAFLKAGNWSAAAEEALDSKWAKQTPKRATEVTNWMRGAE